MLTPGTVNCRRLALKWNFIQMINNRIDRFSQGSWFGVKPTGSWAPDSDAGAFCSLGIPRKPRHARQFSKFGVLFTLGRV